MCTENLDCIDLVAESINFSRDGRPDIFYSNLVASLFKSRSRLEADQSSLPLRMPGGGTNRAVPRYYRGPVPVSTHGMRTFDADIGSRLQGLFLTDGIFFARGGTDSGPQAVRILGGRTEVDDVPSELRVRNLRRAARRACRAHLGRKARRRRRPM